MSLTDKDREIAYAIVLHLQSQVDSQRLRDEQNEGVSVAIQCLSEAYGVELGDKNQKYQGSKTLEVNSCDINSHVGEVITFYVARSAYTYSPGHIRCKLARLIISVSRP